MRYTGRVIMAMVAALGSCLLEPKTPPLPCQKAITYEVDQGFSLSGSLEVDAAFDAWAKASGGYLCFYHGYPTKISVHAVSDERKISALDERALLSGVEHPIGLATPNGTIWIFVSRIESPRSVFGVTLHEIGHQLGLPHYEGSEATWMHQYMTEDPIGLRRVTLRDAVAMCKIQHCLEYVDPSE